jgi:hypothetical protein
MKHIDWLRVIIAVLAAILADLENDEPAPTATKGT